MVSLVFIRGIGKGGRLTLGAEWSIPFQASPPSTSIGGNRYSRSHAIRLPDPYRDDDKFHAPQRCGHSDLRFSV